MVGNWLLKLIVDKLFKTYSCFDCLSSGSVLMKTLEGTTFFGSCCLFTVFIILRWDFFYSFYWTYLFKPTRESDINLRKDVKPKDTLSSLWKMQINFHLRNGAEEKAFLFWIKKISMLQKFCLLSKPDYVLSEK